jgi:Ca-activated chloride channel homolog
VLKKGSSVWLLSALLLLNILLTACGGQTTNQPNSQITTYDSNPQVLNIIAGSEQQLILDQIVVPWCKTEGITCNYTLKGSVDQERYLRTGNTPWDIFWFASSVFQQLGDQANKLKDVKEMFITPLVYAGWKSEMQRLGFVGRDVSLAEILDAVQSHKTTAWLTNPTQSNSGASVYLAVLNHYAGNEPGMPLTLQQLDSPQVKAGITQFVRSLKQTPPSTGTLMNSCVTDPTCKTLFTYEALVIEKNQELVPKGHEPFYAVYPKESLAIADAPMGFLPHRENATAKEQNFLKLQNFILSSDTQKRIEHLGRRPASSVGLSLSNPDTAVFNPDWGIKATLKQQLLVYPAPTVIDAALNHYETVYRQPAHIAYCLDGSGSMGDNGGWDQLKSAVEILFKQDVAAQYYLQANPDDLTSVMIFESQVVNGPDGSWTVQGNDPGKFQQLYDDIVGQSPNDGTNFYACLQKAADLFAQQAGENRKRFVILMTDGQSDTDGQDAAIAALKRIGISVICVPFGSDADLSQLNNIASQTGGKVTTQKNLVDALREATGYR